MFFCRAVPVMGPVRFYCDCKLNTVFLHVDLEKDRGALTKKHWR